MKIKRFNESVLKNKWKPTDKVLKVSVKDSFEVLIDDIRNTEKFQNYGKLLNNWKDEDLFYGLEEYMYVSSNPSFDYQLYDGLGNPIENEPEFDELMKNTKKYNL